MTPEGRGDAPIGSIFSTCSKNQGAVSTNSPITGDPETKLRYLAYDKIIMTRFSMCRFLDQILKCLDLIQIKTSTKASISLIFQLCELIQNFDPFFLRFLTKKEIDLTPTVRYRCSTDNWIAQDTSRFLGTVILANR